MCGIAGIMRLGRSDTVFDLQVVCARMTESLAHRGPDSSGVWTDPDCGLALGHRRLAILDLSPEGRQPMASSCAQIVIVFNGEIYNHAALRSELMAAGQAFRGRSDTEVMLVAFREWGFEKAIEKFVGMFAFALWNRKQRSLILARDRMGEKPLYYGIFDGCLVFASEPKALRSFPGWRGEIDRNALALYMRHSYVPAPYSIFNGVRKLTPGTYLTIKADECHSLSNLVPSFYWDPAKVSADAKANPFKGNPIEAVDALENLLGEAVKVQMEADVPLGAFLSGGIDSSTIVSLMQKNSSRPVRTFTIGFHEQGYNEATYARKVAEHLGTRHTELFMEPRDALNVIPSLPEIYDEPFADYSQIPTYLVSKLTRSHVTVSLSGDGGDELFFGYPRYMKILSLWNKFGKVPFAARRGMSMLMHTVPKPVVEGLLGWVGPILAGKGYDASVSDQFRKVMELLEIPTPEQLYHRYVSHSQEPHELVLGSVEPPTVFSSTHFPCSMGIKERMMFLDAVSYLPDAILTKVDRASMAVSLETRTPFLDHRVVEFAWSLPMEAKFRDGQAKWILRQVLDRHVPRSLVERPKMGFGFPVADWLRGELRDWAEELLDDRKICAQGFLNPGRVRILWSEHLSGRKDNYVRLWDILMFQAWFERQNVLSSNVSAVLT